MLAQKSTSLQHGTCLTLWVQAASRFFRFTRICRETLTFLTQQTFPQPIEAPCGKGDQRALGHAENSALAGLRDLQRYPRCPFWLCDSPTAASWNVPERNSCPASIPTAGKPPQQRCQSDGIVGLEREASPGTSLIMSSTGSTVKGGGWPRSASTFHQAQVICEPSIGAKFGQCVSAARRSTLAQPCSGLPGPRACKST